MDENTDPKPSCTLCVEDHGPCTCETYCGLPASAHQDGTDKRTWEDPAGDVRQAMDEAYADGEGVIEFPDLTEPAQHGYGVIHEGGPDE